MNDFNPYVYVSFETAKLMKEKGFFWDCRDCYSGRNPSGEHEIHLNSPSNNGGLHRISAPTLDVALRWLREKHDLHIMVNCVGKVNYDPIIQRFDGKDFEVDGVEVGVTKKIDGKIVNVRRGFKTYELACDAAIKVCLEKLI